MLTAWLLLALPCQEPGVWRVADGISPADPSAWISGRVLDAATGRPLRGVLVEAFEEEYFEAVDPTPPPAAARRRTDADGAFRFRRADGVEKVRFTAAGRASTTETVNDVDGRRIALFPARPLRLRVTDLAGRPVSGSFALTHQTCSHAPPANVAFGDARGWIELPTPPPLSGLGELEIGAPGFGRALEDLTRLRWLALRDGHVDVALPRRAGQVLRLVGLAEPLRRGRLLQPGPPYAEARIAADGRVRIESPTSDRGNPIVGLLAERGTEVFPCASIRLPRERDITFRPDVWEFDPRAFPGRTATIRIDVRAPGDDQVPAERRVYVLSSTGFGARGPGRHVLPVGPALVVAGGDFSGWRERVRDVVIGADERIEVQLEPEPRVTLSVPPGRHGTVHLQAGDDSITLERRDFDDDLFVPPDRRIVAQFRQSGERRCLVRDGTAASVELDFTDPGTIVRPALDGHEAETTRVRLGSAPGPWRFRGFTLGRQDVERTADGRAFLRAPAGAPFEVEVAAAGYVTTWILGTAKPGGDPLVPVGIQLATLAVSGPVTALFVGAHAVGGDEAHAGIAVAPGPFTARIVVPDGRSFVTTGRLDPSERHVLASPAE